MDTANHPKLSNTQKKRLEKVVRNFPFWRVKYNSPTPMKVTPAVEVLKEGTSTDSLKHGYRARTSPKSYDTLATFVSKAKSLGMLEPNIAATHSSPVKTVEKPDGGMRVTFDLRRVNNITKQKSWAATDVQNVMARMRGKKWFAKLDLVDAFWQLPLDEKSRPLFAVWTPMGTLPKQLVQEFSVCACCGGQKPISLEKPLCPKYWGYRRRESCACCSCVIRSPGSLMCSNCLQIWCNTGGRSQVC
jgi:hypothetical protein